MATDALLDALRRSVETRNSDPARMRRWLDDFADRTEGGHEDGYQRDPVSEQGRVA